MGKILVALVLAGLVYFWWRRQAVARAPMRPSEARALLGVGEGASLDDIRAAHRRLIAKVHPDAGGSAGLATRVNAARDALIAELKRQ
ncbi:MAG TPA: DnaJ domain-containing protein [Allosphingosinicella sp.]|nr:DnaJ domain-containing protein [Allosphingosinicella sp.]